MPRQGFARIIKYDLRILPDEQWYFRRKGLEHLKSGAPGNDSSAGLWESIQAIFGDVPAVLDGPSAPSVYASRPGNVVFSKSVCFHRRDPLSPGKYNGVQYGKLQPCQTWSGGLNVAGIRTSSFGMAAYLAIRRIRYGLLVQPFGLLC